MTNKSVFKSKNIERPYTILILLLLTVSTLAVYVQVETHDFIRYDDYEYVVENRHVRLGLTLDNVKWAFTATHASNWHPLTWLSHMLDAHLYGLNPGPHHLTNLLFHLASTLLLFFVFKRMTGHLWQSAFVAGVFALHPLHVESVAWIAERKDVLSTFFWMLTIGGYARYVERPDTHRYLLALFCFTLGLMAKPMLVTLPFVLLLLDYWPLKRFTYSDFFKRRMVIKSLIWEKSPFFALTAASCIVTYLVQQKGGAVNPLEHLSFTVRIANALVSYVTYIGKTIIPVDLAVLYPHPGMPPLWQTAGAGVLLTGIFLLTIKMMQRYPYLAVGWLWYLGTLVPAIGLVQVGQQAMADRYTYIPLIGIFIMIAWGAPDLLGGWKHKRTGLRGVAAAVFLICMIFTWHQVRLWKSSMTLFRHTINVTTRNYIAHFCMGAALADQERMSEAVQYYANSLKINPNYAEAHLNYGKAMIDQGKRSEAIDHFNRALQIKPDFAGAYSNLGNVYFSQGDIETAIEHYYRALQADPEMAKAYYNLGVAREKQGRNPEAVEDYMKALQIEPDHAEARYNMALILDRQGNTNEAITQYRKVIQINPSHEGALNALGTGLARQGNPSEAIGYFTRALDAKPDFAGAHNNLGLVLAEQGRLSEAIQHYSEALRINPEFSNAYINMGNAQASQGKIDEAVATYNKALGYRPADGTLHYKLGTLYQRKGEFDQALAHYQKTLSIHPDHIPASSNLAILYARRGEYDSAIAQFKKTLILQPGRPDICYNIARIYALQDRVDESLIWLQHAVDRGFNNWRLLQSDKSMATIRDTEYYKMLVKGL